MRDDLGAIFCADEHWKTLPYDCFNAATKDYMSVKEIADLVVDAMGLRRDRVTYAFTGGDRGWKGDVPVVRFDLTKIHALGWRARRSACQALLDSIKSMVIDARTGKY